MHKHEGKKVKNYTMGKTKLQLDGEMEVIDAIKDGKQTQTICVVKKKNLNQEMFVQYNNYIFENKGKVFPQYLEVLQS